MPKNFNFITPVSMPCTQEQYERDLRKPLLEMGYEERTITNWKITPILTNNFLGKVGLVCNVEVFTKHDNDRYYIHHYNPQLFLALAAMTDRDRPIYGEYVAALIDISSTLKPSITTTKNKLYKHMENLEIGSLHLTIRDDNGIYYGFGEGWNKTFRKATKEEIINHFTKMKEETEPSDENRLFKMPDYTFFTRLYSFIEDIQVCDAMSDEEKEYLVRTVRNLLKEQIKTAKGDELDYLKRCNEDLFKNKIDARMDILNALIKKGRIQKGRS